MKGILCKRFRGIYSLLDNEPKRARVANALKVALERVLQGLIDSLVDPRPH